MSDPGKFAFHYDELDAGLTCRSCNEWLSLNQAWSLADVIDVADGHECPKETP